MHSEGVAPGAGPLQWPMPRRFVWLWVLIVMWGWWTAVARTAASGEPAPAIPLVSLAVAARLAGVLVEAGWYVAAWRVFGCRLPFVWFAAWLVTLTLFDLFGDSLRALAGHRPALAPWLAPVAGIGLLPAAHGWSAGVRLVLGSLGVLMLGRVAFQSLLQARATGASRTVALALTGGSWLACRVVLWWTADLVRGMSPMP